MSEIYYPSREDFQKLEAAQNDLDTLNALIKTFRGAEETRVVAFPKNLMRASYTLGIFLGKAEEKGFVILDNAEFGRLREEAFRAEKMKRPEHSPVAKPTAAKAATRTLPDNTPAHAGKTAGKKHHSRKSSARQSEDAVHGKHPGTKGREDQKKHWFFDYADW